MPEFQDLSDQRLAQAQPAPNTVGDNLHSNGSPPPAPPPQALASEDAAEPIPFKYEDDEEQIDGFGDAFVNVDVPAGAVLPKRVLSGGVKMLLGSRAEEEQASALSASTRQKLMWLLLFAHTLFYGGMAFILRLQNYLDDEGLSNGTLHGFFVLGMLTGASPLVMYNMRHIKPSNFRRVHIFAFLAGLTNNIGINGYMFLTAVGGEASALAPLSSLYIIVPVLAGFLLFGDKVTFRKVFGIALGLGATAMFAVDGMSSGASVDFSNSSELGAFLVTFFCYGVSTVLLQLISGTNNQQLAVSYNLNILAYVGTGFIAVFAIHGGMDFAWDQGRMLVFLAGVSGAGSNLCFILFSRMVPEQASVVAPLSGIFILYPIILGIAVLDESISTLKIIAIVAAIVATPLMAVTSFHELIRSMACIKAPVVADASDLETHKGMPGTVSVSVLVPAKVSDGSSSDIKPDYIAKGDEVVIHFIEGGDALEEQLHSANIIPGASF